MKIHLTITPIAVSEKYDLIWARFRDPSVIDEIVPFVRVWWEGWPVMNALGLANERFAVNSFTCQRLSISIKECPGLGVWIEHTLMPPILQLLFHSKPRGLVICEVLRMATRSHDGVFDSALRVLSSAI
jgi:hypothetical protein